MDQGSVSTWGLPVTAETNLGVDFFLFSFIFVLSLFVFIVVCFCFLCFLFDLVFV